MAEPIDPRVVDLNTRMFVNRLLVKRVLKRAGVPASSWWRWVHHGVIPRHATVRKLTIAIDALTAEKELTHGQESRLPEPAPE